MRNLKTTMKATLSLLLAAVFALAIPLSGNAAEVSLETGAATAEETSLEASSATAEEVPLESSTATEEKLQDVTVHLTVQLPADSFGLINRSTEIGVFKFAIYAAENIKFNSDPYYYRKGQEIGTEYARARGRNEYLYQDNSVLFVNKLPKGKYYLKLKEYSSQYYTTNTSKKYSFTVEDSSTWYSSRQDIDLSENGAKFTATLLKQKISPKVIGKDTGKALSGAKIQIIATDYNNNTVVVYTGTSNSSGVFTNLPQLTVGEYEVREIKAPTNYTLNSKAESLYIDGNDITDSAKEIRIYNDKKKTYLYGDVDFDGKITSNDSMLITRNSVGKTTFSKLQKTLADVDGDGKITSADSLEVLRYSVGLLSKTKVGKTYTE